MSWTNTICAAQRRQKRSSVPLLSTIGALCLCLSLNACGPQTSAATAPPEAPLAAAPEGFYSTGFEKRPNTKTLTELGRTLFSDTSLSASGTISCASCHSPAHAYRPANALPVQTGGIRGTASGLRAAPSLKYQQSVPPFSEHFYDTDGNDSADMGPTGGRAWDGRADSAHEQARLPLLSPLEMANDGPAAVVRKLRGSPNARRFRDAFGEHVLNDVSKAWNGLLLALEVFQQSPQDFYPYSSKYDAFLRGQATLSPKELRGMQAFNAQDKGNCAQCHISGIKHGVFPVFTDYGHIALGVPRNKGILANRDPAFADLGLCGPLRTDLKDHPEYCGLFKTPGLRNVALRQSFFHNGFSHRLEDAVRFYVERDRRPERYYPRDSAGGVVKFNDLPLKYHGNINTESPFDRKPTDRPSLTAAEIADVVAFLKTLTDGYSPEVRH